MRIIAPIGNQTASHGIPRNVPNLGAKVFLTSNDVIIEIFLPENPRRVLLEPKTTCLLEIDHRLPCVGFAALPAQHQVHVLRHETVNRHRALVPFGNGPQNIQHGSDGVWVDK